jgi:hypothetical protein
MVFKIMIDEFIINNNLYMVVFWPSTLLTLENRDGDGGENPPERGLGMRMIFHPPPRRDSVLENY